MIDEENRIFNNDPIVQYFIVAEATNKKSIYYGTEIVMENERGFYWKQSISDKCIFWSFERAKKKIQNLKRSDGPDRANVRIVKRTITDEVIS